MIALSQDPALPFDLDTVTVPHYAGMVFPFAPVILLAWTVPLAALVVLSLLAYFAGDPESKGSARAASAVPVAAWLAGAAFLGPVILSQLIGATDDAFPNVIGYVTATEKNPNGEFVVWSQERYGVELTENQTETLRHRKRNYGMGSENVSDVVLVGGREVHGYFDGSAVRLMSGGTELDVKL